MHMSLLQLLLPPRPQPMVVTLAISTPFHMSCILHMFLSFVAGPYCSCCYRPGRNQGCHSQSAPPFDTDTKNTICCCDLSCILHRSLLQLLLPPRPQPMAATLAISTPFTSLAPCTTVCCVLQVPTAAAATVQDATNCCCSRPPTYSTSSSSSSAATTMPTAAHRWSNLGQALTLTMLMMPTVKVTAAAAAVHTQHSRGYAFCLHALWI
jgi:hypothetical protein